MHYKLHQIQAPSWFDSIVYWLWHCDCAVNFSVWNIKAISHSKRAQAYWSAGRLYTTQPRFHFIHAANIYTSPYTRCQYIHDTNTPKANWMFRNWRLKTKHWLCTMTCYWLRVERLLTLVNKMETFGRWTAFCAESQHDLVWSGQGQGFSCKNTIWQTLKSLRVACGGKCAPTNCSLKVVYMTDGLITLISLQGKGWREQVSNNGPKTDGYPKKYSSCLQHVHRCSGYIKRKSPTERLTYPWAKLWAFPKSKCTFTKLYPKEETKCWYRWQLNTTVEPGGLNTLTMNWVACQDFWPTAHKAEIEMIWIYSASHGNIMLHSRPWRYTE